MADPELNAMQMVAAALSDLDEAGRGRVLSWAISRFGAGPTIQPSLHTSRDAAQFPDGNSLPEFFGQLDIRSEKEKALVVAYWIQFREGLAEFVSQEVNSRLKDLGYPIKNITDALSQLQAENPKRVVQMRKSGSSRQARKTYKVTDAGKRSVESLLAAMER